MKIDKQRLMKIINEELGKLPTLKTTGKAAPWGSGMDQFPDLDKDKKELVGHQ